MLKWVVIGVAVGLALLAGWAAARELPGFWDPCMTWGEGSSGSGSMSASPSSACPRQSGTSETKAGAALRMAAVFGTAIVAGILASLGAWRHRAGPVLFASGLMFAETVLLFLGISAAFVLTLMAGGLYLAAGLQWRRRPGATVSQPL